MAINLTISDNRESVPLSVRSNASPLSASADNGSPYYVGARAYVEKSGNKSTITIIDKYGTTTADVYDGSGGESVQSDWAQSDTTQSDYIKNKPTIPTKASDLTNDEGYATIQIVRW